MPIGQSIWKVGESPEKLSLSSLKNENELEDMICQDIAIIYDQWLPIGRQVVTEHGGKIDILAIDQSGNLVIIELKKNKTPREVVTQAIDYASWVKNLDSAKIASIYEKYGNGIPTKFESLDEALLDKFNTTFNEDEINQGHQIVIVASELDPSTERIVLYLNDYDIPINTVFFNVFRDADNRYLSRAWLIDPAKTEEIVNLPKSNQKEPWNGEYYVSFGHEMGRHWDDAMKYGFVSAGGGPWYSRTLKQLSKEDRVWVNIPHTGYVGVATVEDSAVMAKDFTIQTEDGEKPILEIPLKASYHKQFIDDEEKAEYFVKVKWEKVVPIKQAVSKIGFFGNQNSVCKPRDSKWLFTIDTLKKTWGIT